MLEFLILAAVGLAGYAQARGWAVPLGATLLTSAAWWRKVRLLRQHPQVPFSSKMTTYLVVSVLLNVLLATASYLAGRAVRWWLG